MSDWPISWDGNDGVTTVYHNHVDAPHKTLAVFNGALSNELSIESM